MLFRQKLYTLAAEIILAERRGVGVDRRATIRLWTRWHDGLIRMPTRTQWHGTPTEELELTRALTRHCTCMFDAQSRQLCMCAGHQMFRSDQRAIDGLLFSRRIAARLRNEEFHARVATHVASDAQLR